MDNVIIRIYIDLMLLLEDILIIYLVNIKKKAAYAFLCRLFNSFINYLTHGTQIWIIDKGKKLLKSNPRENPNRIDFLDLIANGEVCFQFIKNIWNISHRL